MLSGKTRPTVPAQRLFEQRRRSREQPGLTQRLPRMDVKFPILGFLMESELTGYDLKQRFTGSVGFYYPASDGSVYPALRKLADDGLVRMREHRTGRRARKLYAITAAGRAWFLRMLAEPPTPTFVYDDGVIKLYFGHHRPDVGLMHLRRMSAFGAEASATLNALRAEVTRMEPSPFRRAVFEIGHRITNFKAALMAELAGMVERELRTQAASGKRRGRVGFEGRAASRARQ